MLKLEFDSFEEAVEYVMDLVGGEFEKSLQLSQAILANPDQYTGPQAAIAAIKLSNHRYHIGVKAQLAKIKSAQTKNLQDRLVKDALMVGYDALGEMINTLKLTARHDHDLSGTR